MSVSQSNNSSSNQSISFSILDLKAQAVRLPISKAAQILLSEFLTWAGERGYCWWGTPAIAKDLGWSVSSVWRRSGELQDAHLLEVIPRAGRSNYWVPLPGKTKMERIRNELTPLATPRGPSEKKKETENQRCTVPDLGTSTKQPPPSPEPNANAVKSDSSEIPPTAEHHQLISKKFTQASKPKPKANLNPHQWLLIQAIEQECHDFHSRGHFVNLVRRHEEEVIRTALSLTREKVSLESGVNAGAYFYRTLQSLTGDTDTPTFHQLEPRGRIHQHPGLPRFITPPVLAEPEPESVDPDALKRGWKLKYRGAGVQGMLSLVERCVPPCVDVRGLLVDVRETFAGVEESVLVDRLLDAVATRMKHAERMGETKTCPKSTFQVL